MTPSFLSDWILHAEVDKQCTYTQVYWQKNVSSKIQSLYQIYCPTKPTDPLQLSIVYRPSRRSSETRRRKMFHCVLWDSTAFSIILRNNKSSCIHHLVAIQHSLHSPCLHAMTTSISRCWQSATLISLTGFTETCWCQWRVHCAWLRSITNDAKYWWLYYVLSLNTQWTDRSRETKTAVGLGYY